MRAVMDRSRAAGLGSWLVGYAAAAYLPFDELGEHLANGGFDRGVENELADLSSFDWGYDVEVFGHAFTNLQGVRVAVVFARGTELEWRDFKTDGFIWPDRWRDISGHEGFLFSGLAVLPAVRDFLEEADAAEVYFTGHSLGGAIAAVLGAAVKDARSVVVTFGQPRVFRGGTARRFDRDARRGTGPELLRFVNAADKVPRLLWYLYQHAGTLCFFAPGGELLIGKPAAKAARWMGLRSWVSLGWRGLARHGVAKYAEQFRRLFSR